MMEAITLVFVIFAFLSINVHAANDPDIFKLAKIAEDSFSNTSVNVCDETNTNNSYVYKLLQIIIMLTLTIPIVSY